MSGRKRASKRRSRGNIDKAGVAGTDEQGPTNQAVERLQTLLAQVQQLLPATGTYLGDLERAKQDVEAVIGAAQRLVDEALVTSIEGLGSRGAADR